MINLSIIELVLGDGIELARRGSNDIARTYLLKPVLLEWR